VRSGGSASYYVTECSRSDVDTNFAVAGDRFFEISVDRCFSRFQDDCCFHLLLPFPLSTLYYMCTLHMVYCTRTACYPVNGSEP
jgi:hypothetical protein